MNTINHELIIYIYQSVYIVYRNGAYHKSVITCNSDIYIFVYNVLIYLYI